MAGERIELPRCRAYEAREPQPVLQPAIQFCNGTNETRTRDLLRDRQAC